MFPSFVLLSVMVQTHHQFVRVATKCFCRPFDTRFILGDRRHWNLEAPTEKANLSLGNCEFHNTRLFLQLSFILFFSYCFNLFCSIMFMLFGMSKHLVYAFPGFYNKFNCGNNFLTLYSSINSILVFSCFTTCGRPPAHVNGLFANTAYSCHKIHQKCIFICCF